MRIVLVYQHFMVSGVGSTKPYDLARYLVGAGHEVAVICGRGYLSQGMDVPRGMVTRMKVEGIDLVCLGVEYRQRMGFVRRIMAFLAFTFLAMAVVLFGRRYDVLVASSTPLTVGLVGLVSRLRGRPWVFEIRDLWPEFPIRAGYLRSRLLIAVSTFFEEWFYRSAARVSAISSRMRDRLIERGFPGDKIVFIPTGVALKDFEAAAPDRAWRTEHGLDGRMVAVYVGSHGRNNQLEYAVEAAECLRGVENLKIVLIGDGSEKPRLVADAQRRGLTNIVFLPPVPRSRVPGILKACDVTLVIDEVCPGSEYAMPNKFFDCLAAGLPMITNTPAELWDHVKEYDCGILTDPLRPDELARALVALKADPARAKAMGERALKLAADRFDRAALHRRWESLLLEVAVGAAPAVAAPTDRGAGERTQCQKPRIGPS
jgi:glycosyltransferase involved in cell wall biosynthesis